VSHTYRWTDFLTANAMLMYIVWPYQPMKQCFAAGRASYDVRSTTLLAATDWLAISVKSVHYSAGQHVWEFFTFWAMSHEECLRNNNLSAILKILPTPVYNGSLYLPLRPKS